MVADILNLSVNWSVEPYLPGFPHFPHFNSPTPIIVVVNLIGPNFVDAVHLNAH